MNSKELDDLPEYKSVGEEVIDLPDARYPDKKGDRFIRRFPIKGYVMTHSKDDCFAITDEKGITWATGDINGVKHKIRTMF